MKIISTRQFTEYTIEEPPVFEGIVFDGKSLEQPLDPIKVLLVTEKGMMHWTDKDEVLRSKSFPNRGAAQKFLQSVEAFHEIFNGV